MSHIFISYSRRDIDFAQKMVDALAANALDTWIDWKSIPKGEDWEQEIYRGIEEADAFLFLISPDSVASEMCNKEIDHAVKNGKRILPIVLRDTDRRIINPEINKRNWIFCRDGRDDFDKAVDETRKTIHTDYEWLKYHTKLQLKALEWQEKKQKKKYNSRLLRGKDLREAELQLAKVRNQDDAQPTSEQREYILESRRNEKRQQGLIFGRVVVVLIIITSAYLYFQFRANQSRAIQLATEASNQMTGDGDVLEAARLSVQSYSLSQTAEGEQALQMIGTYAFPVAVLTGSQADISPDGKMGLVVGSDKRTVSIWDIKDKKQISILQDVDGDISSPTFSLDGHKVVGFSNTDGSLNTDLVIWDAETGQRLNIYSGVMPFGLSFGHNDLLVSWMGLSQIWDLESNNLIMRSKNIVTASPLLICPDGTRVIVGSHELDRTKPLEIRSIPDGAVLATLQGYIGTVNSAAFSPDGTRIVSTGTDGKIYVWNSETGELVTAIESPSETTSAFFSSDGREIITLGSKKLRVWNVNSKKILGEFEHVSDEVYPNSIDPTGTQVVVVGTDNEARVMNIISGTQSALLHGHAAEGLSAWFTLDGSQVVTRGNDGTARLWDLTTIQKSANLQQDNRTVYAITGASRNIRIFEANGGTGWIVDLVTGNELMSLQGDIAKISSAAFNLDGSRVVTGDSNNAIILWDVATGTHIKSWLAQAAIGSLLFNQDGTQLVSTEDSGVVQLWNVNGTQHSLTFTHPSIILASKFNPEGSKVVTLDSDGSAYVWSTKNGQILAKFGDKNGSARDIGFSATEILMISASSNGSVTAWNAESGQRVSTMQGHSQWVYIAKVSQDGTRLATASTDRSIRVWDIQTGKQISTLQENIDDVSAIALSPDNSIIATKHSGGWVRLWRADSGLPITVLPCLGDLNTMQFTTDGKQIITECGNIPAVVAWNIDPSQMKNLVEERLSSLLLIER